MRDDYFVYANGFPEGSLFKTDTWFGNLEEAVEYAKKLIEDNNRSFVNTEHTQVRKVATEIVWDSAGVK